MALFIISCQNGGYICLYDNIYTPTSCLHSYGCQLTWGTLVLLCQVPRLLCNSPPPPPPPHHHPTHTHASFLMAHFFFAFYTLSLLLLCLFLCLFFFFFFSKKKRLKTKTKQKQKTMQSICKMEHIGIFHAAQSCFSEKYLMYKYPEKKTFVLHSEIYS